MNPYWLADVIRKIATRQRGGYPIQEFLELADGIEQAADEENRVRLEETLGRLLTDAEWEEKRLGQR